MRRALRRAAIVAVVLVGLAGAAYAVSALLLVLADSESVASPPLRVDVLPAGSYQSAHPYAPYYVVPRKRFVAPSELSRPARNKLLTKPASALSKGAMAGSPQIVRLRLRTTSSDPLVVEAVRFDVVSDARPLRGWYAAQPGCMFEPVQRALTTLDARRPAVRYVAADGARSRTLALVVRSGAPQILELQAAARGTRVAWTAELTVRDGDGRRSTVAVDDGGEPFRVTSERASRAYEPIYGAAGIVGFKRVSAIRAGRGC